MQPQDEVSPAPAQPLAPEQPQQSFQPMPPPAVMPSYTGTAVTQAPAPVALADKMQRINRLTFFVSMVINNLVVPFVFYFAILAAFFGGSVAHFNGSFLLVGMIVIFLTAIYWLWTLLRACLYRCFDIGMSQLWILILLVPVLSLILLIFLCLKKGQPEPNKYGYVPHGLQLKRTLPLIPQSHKSSVS